VFPKRKSVLVLVGALLAASLAASFSAEAASSVRPTEGRAIAHRNGKLVKGIDRLPTAKASGLGHQAGEPTLGLTPGGDVFVATGAFNWYGPAGAGMTPDVLKTEDKGKTWEVVSPRVLGQKASAPTSMDPYILVDNVDGDNARVFTIDLTVACSYMSYSDDAGASWVTNPLACGRPVNDHQTLFAGPPVSSPTVGYPHIVYYCWNDIGSSSCSKSLDGGLSFTPTGEPSFYGYPPDEGTEGDLCGGLHGHGVVGKDGAIYIPREYCGKPFLAISHDEGLSWDRVQVAKTKKDDGVGGSDPSVAVDAKGNIYYLWVARKDRMPYLVVSKDGGKKWSDPVMVAAPGIKETNIATLTVGDVGKIAIAYYGSENSLYQQCRVEGNKLAPCDAQDYVDTLWNGYITVSADALSKSPLFVTGTINKVGTKDDPTGSLITHTCGPGRCGSVWDFIDVEIGPDGMPFAIYVDGCVLDECKDRGSGPYDGHVHEGLMGMLVGGPRLR
jgi:hypothetical protein